MRALLLTSLLCLATREARAAASTFIELDSACPITAEALEQRVTEALLGERDPELHAAITIREAKGAYEVALQTRRGNATSAVKALSAPSCEEAVQAATIVLALAFGRAAPAVSTPPARAVAELSAISGPVWPRVAIESRADRRSPPLAAPPPQASQPLRLALSAGVDSGTLPMSTAYLAAGLSQSFAPLEVYGALRYGAPHVDENVADTGSERTRLDFGMLELGACYGLGRAIHVSACAGSELGVVRTAQSLRLADGTAREIEATRLRLAGVLTALLAYRGGPVEPQLELAAVGLAAERRKGSALVGSGAAGAPRVGLRAGLGAAVAF